MLIGIISDSSNGNRRCTVTSKVTNIYRRRYDEDHVDMRGRTVCHACRWAITRNSAQSRRQGMRHPLERRRFLCSQETQFLTKQCPNVKIPLDVPAPLSPRIGTRLPCGCLAQMRAEPFGGEGEHHGNSLSGDRSDFVGMVALRALRPHGVQRAGPYEQVGGHHAFRRRAHRADDLRLTPDGGARQRVRHGQLVQLG